MATLVFSTIGQALGGPVGGAIGALIGQSLDQQLLSPARRGPRVGDLNVQTSTYGTQIPRIYGSMRVAGSVVWATDLIESEQTSGAKGQPDVTYGYSVSLAVALSSRVAGSIGRIWADGQLLRGSAGDFKVPTTFRFYDGSEDQPIDPLIGSIEGISSTPAYRGVALGVFEDLQLATFGNRIPFMTFEVLADAAPPTVASILNDASGGRIAVNEDDSVLGFAAYGGSIARALDPLVSAFGTLLFDSGLQFLTPGEATFVDADELGSSADGALVPSRQLERLSTDSAPGTLRLTYYDPSRDYQTGEARASAGEPTGSDVQQDLPVVLDADQAKGIAQRIIAREWVGLERLTLRLPPRRIGLEPGTVISSSVAAGAWVVEKVTIDGFVTIAELRRDLRPSVAIAGDGGRAVAAGDVVEAPATLAVFDIPDVTGSGLRTPMVAIAASCPSSGWRRRMIEITGPGVSISARSPARKSLLGYAVSVLGAGAAELLDQINLVDVQLIDSDQWLTSCDDVALNNGANQAVLGSEIVQFGVATALGNGRFRLSRLLRGRAGTDWAIGEHGSNETFCVLDADRLALVEVPLTARGAVLNVRDDCGSTAQSIFDAEAVRPFAPVFIKAIVNSAGALEINWLRRSRAGLAWLDQVDVPVVESAEQYRVEIQGSAGSNQFTTNLQALTVPNNALSALGSGRADISVTQIGDFVASRPAPISIILP